MNGLTGLFDEHTPRDPQAWYGHTKLMAEAMFKAAFQGNNRCFNVAPVMGCGVYPDDNASDMRKFASVVYKYINEQEQKQPMVCNQNYEFFKAYVDIKVVMEQMLDYVDTFVYDAQELDDVLGHQVHEAVFAGTKVQRFGDILFDITLEMTAHLKYGKAFEDLEGSADGNDLMMDVNQIHNEILNDKTKFINNPENDYLGCHLPEFNFMLHLADTKYQNRQHYEHSELQALNSNIFRWQPMLCEIHNEEPEHFELVKKLVESHLDQIGAFHVG